MLDMYKEINKGITLNGSGDYNDKHIKLNRSGNYIERTQIQKMEILKNREKLGMETIDFEKCNIITLMQQMEDIGTQSDSVIITPRTNKWKDLAENFKGIGKINFIELDGTLQY